jgi:3-deoxy-D-manno-octulosonic-acid transferase
VLAAQREGLKGLPGALSGRAPRHPPRFAQVAARIGEEGFSFVRRSRRGATVLEISAQVLLLDTLGELMDFYAGADVAFVGGSLVPIGGHNLLEPAALAVPVLTGPSVSNAPEIARLLVSRGAAELIPDATSLGRRVAALLADPEARRRVGERGRTCVEDSRGALQKLLALIEPLLGKAG